MTTTALAFNMGGGEGQGRHGDGPVNEVRTERKGTWRGEGLRYNCGKIMTV